MRHAHPRWIRRKPWLIRDNRPCPHTYRFRPVQIVTIEDAIEFLTGAGFPIVSCWRDDDIPGRPITQLSFRGRGVLGNVECSTSARAGYLLADHVECYDKYGKCPLFMVFPIETSVLRRYLRRLGSPRGYRISNSYRYLDKNPFPSQRNRIPHY